MADDDVLAELMSEEEVTVPTPSSSAALAATTVAPVAAAAELESSTTAQLAKEEVQEPTAQPEANSTAAGVRSEADASIPDASSAEQAGEPAEPAASADSERQEASDAAVPLLPEAGDNSVEGDVAGEAQHSTEDGAPAAAGEKVDSKDKDAPQNGCCNRCMRALSGRRKSCKCQVPFSKLHPPLEDFGCYVCGCRGCNPTDPGPERVPGLWEKEMERFHAEQAVKKAAAAETKGKGKEGGKEGRDVRAEKDGNRAGNRGAQEQDRSRSSRFGPDVSEKGASTSGLRQDPRADGGDYRRGPGAEAGDYRRGGPDGPDNRRGAPFREPIHTRPDERSGPQYARDAPLDRSRDRAPMRDEGRDRYERGPPPRETDRRGRDELMPPVRGHDDRHAAPPVEVRVAGKLPRSLNVCESYMNGFCKFGNECKFVHPVPEDEEKLRRQYDLPYVARREEAPPVSGLKRERYEEPMRAAHPVEDYPERGHKRSRAEEPYGGAPPHYALPERVDYRDIPLRGGPPAPMRYAEDVPRRSPPRGLPLAPPPRYADERSRYSPPRHSAPLPQRSYSPPRDFRAAPAYVEDARVARDRVPMNDRAYYPPARRDELPPPRREEYAPPRREEMPLRREEFPPRREEYAPRRDPRDEPAWARGGAPPARPDYDQRAPLPARNGNGGYGGAPQYR